MAAGYRDASSSVRVGVLGPLRLVVAGTDVEVPGPKRRALLALLTLAEGRILPTDDVVEALWPMEPPGSARQALHTHVSRLRAHLGPGAGRLQTRQEGYRLDLDPADVDLGEARTLLQRARDVRTQNPGDALALLHEALGLWRGPALADLTDVAPVAAAVRGFERLRQEVVDALVGAAVTAGRADTVAHLSAESLAADPLREPAVLAHVRVLAATGRSAEALDVARAYRHRLADETGLDPSEALGDLEREIAAGATGGGVRRPSLTARPVTRLVGREAQVAALHRLLAGERLVTVVGPGGVGKTRVALEVAHRSGEATALLLAPVTDPTALPHALAGALRLDVVRGDVLAACLAVLGDRPGLLVIDNCEHVLDAARDLVAEILSACPRVTLLATSREPLGLAAEYTWRLSPLPTPRSDDDDLARVPSVALFLERAERVRRGAASAEEQLPAVADVVRRLDGMPLAIELAAGRLSTLSLTDLRDRLDRSLDLLGGVRPGADARHRTLRATVEWSYELLGPDERRVFRYLSVFPDGVDLATAERLAAEVAPSGDPAGVLARLVDASMIEVRFDRSTRFRMLETLRAYGLDRLAALGESQEAVDRLVRWALELTSRLDEALRGEGEADADAQLRRELGNLRTAWLLALGRPEPDDAVAMIVALVEAVTYRDLLEIRTWAETLADDPRLAGHPRASEVFGVAAEAAYHRGDLDRAERLARAGLAGTADPVRSSFCRQVLSVVELARGHYGEVIEHALAAVAVGPQARDALGVAALAAAYGGDLERARTLFATRAGDGRSPSARAWNHYVSGELDGLAGRGTSAEQHYLTAVELARDSGSTFLVGIASVGLMSVRARAGQITEALVGCRDVVDYFARTGNWTHLWTTLRNLADLLRQLGDDETARLLDTAADAAPDAPPVSRPSAAATAPSTASPPPSRAVVLDVARAAIARHLARET